MSDNAKILAKIKKCLALSASSNEHEAEAALRQARKLMEEYGITGLDISAADAEARTAKSGAKKTPSNWESALAAKIGDAFACQVIFSSWSGWHFIGCGAASELASYAFSVLLRQAKRARQDHLKAKLKRCKVATKVRRADLFSEGWVRSVVRTITAFAGNDQQSAAIDAYVAKHYPSLRDLKPRDRNDGREMNRHEYGDYIAGSQSGKDAQLNRGVGGQASTLALGVAA